MSAREGKDYRCVELYRFIRMMIGEEVSDREIARRLGMGWRSFYNLKTGQRHLPSMEALEDIAAVLKVERRLLNELVSGGATPEEIHAIAAKQEGAGGEKLVVETGESEEEGGGRNLPYYRREVKTVLIMADSSGVINSWGGQGEEVYGYSAEEAIGMHVSELHPAAAGEEVRNSLERLSGGQPMSGITTHVGKGGRQFRAHLSVDPVRNSGGEIVLLQGVVKTYAEEEMEQKANALNAIAFKLNNALSEEQVFNIITGAGAARQLSIRIYLLDKTGEKLLLRMATSGHSALVEIVRKYGLDEKIFAFPIDKVKLFRQVIRERKTVHISDPAKTVVEATKAIKVYYIYKLVKKRVKFGPSITTPLTIDDEVIGAISVESSWISERDVPLVEVFGKQVARMLHTIKTYRKAETRAERYRVLWRDSAEPLVAINAESGRVVEANGEFQRLIKFDGMEIIGKELRELFPAAERKRLAAATRRASRSGKASIELTKLLSSWGAEIPVSVNFVAVHSNGRKLIQVCLGETSGR